MCPPSFLVCIRLMTCKRAHTHAQLRGNIGLQVTEELKGLVEYNRFRHEIGSWKVNSKPYDALTNECSVIHLFWT